MALGPARTPVIRSRNRHCPGSRSSSALIGREDVAKTTVNEHTSPLRTLPHVEKMTSAPDSDTWYTCRGADDAPPGVMRISDEMSSKIRLARAPRPCALISCGTYPRLVLENKGIRRKSLEPETSFAY